MLLATSSISGGLSIVDRSVIALDVVRLKTTSLSLTVGKTRFFSHQDDTTGSLYALIARRREKDLCECDTNLAKSSEKLGTSSPNAQEQAASLADKLSLDVPLSAIPRCLGQSSLNRLVYV